MVVEHVTHERDATAGLQARFEDQSARVRDALRSLGADARIGELAGEYCPGEYSVNVGRRAWKVAGVAQRMVRHGAVTSAVVVAGGGARLRAAIADVYGALELPVDVATAGALDEHVPGVTVERGRAGAARRPTAPTGRSSRTPSCSPRRAPPASRVVAGAG